MSGQPHVTTLGDLHAELLTRLATGGDRKLLAQVCRALGEGERGKPAAPF